MCPRLAGLLNGQKQRARKPEAWAQEVPPSLPSPPCPPLQRQDVRFCQVAHTYKVLGLVTTCCLCVIATQALLATPQAGREQSVLVVVRAAEVALCTAHGQGDEGGLHILPTGA